MTSQPCSESKEEKIRRLCKTNLKFLSKELLSVKDWSKVHDDLAAFLRRPSKRKLILIPRNHLKSTVITKSSSIQYVLNNFDGRVLISNATWDNAQNFMGSIRKLLTHGSYLPMYFGKFDSDQWNTDALVIKQRKAILDSPTWATAGIDKELTSQHYDLIIADDLVAPKNVETANQREKVFNYYLSLFDLLDPEGQIIVVGTRYHQDDLYSRILDENATMGNWDVFIRTAYNDDGSVLFPEKFTVEQLNEIRNRPRGAYHFASQYLNNPIDPDASDFKQSQIKYYDPTTKHPGSLYLTVDPAISLSKDADASAGTVAGMFADRTIRVVDFFQKRCVPSELVDEIFRLVSKWRLHRVGIETFGFQKTLKYEIQRRQRESGVFFSIDELGKRHTGRAEPPLSKEARIRRLQPYFEQGLVEIRRDMSELVTEILSFPRGKHDDLCLIKGTQIATPLGNRCIEDIREGDSVITPLGLRKVMASRFTGIAPVIDGPRGIIGTQNHPVFANDDFIPMDALTYKDKLSTLSWHELLLWKYRKLLSSMVAPTDLWGKENIIFLSRIRIRDGSIRKDFMSLCGNFIRRRQFQRGMKFIIGMVTLLIINTKIWNVYRATSTAESLIEWIKRNSENIFRKSVIWLQNGIGRMRGVLGIRDTLAVYGITPISLNAAAGSAGPNFSVTIEALSSAVRPVSRRKEDNPVSITWINYALSVANPSQRTAILESLPATFPVAENSSGKLAAVYNLTVEEDNCYYANGILVGNCDALAYQLDYLVPSLATQSAKDTPDYKMDESGNMRPTGAWWNRQMRQGQQTVYDRFFADMKSKT